MGIKLSGFIWEIKGKINKAIYRTLYDIYLYDIWKDIIHIYFPRDSLHPYSGSDNQEEDGNTFHHGCAS
jgi:hypothetical protein